MKYTILLLLVMSAFITATQAQKKEKQITGYAITAPDKGGHNWNGVRLVDITTGKELKSVYQSSQQTEALNARTKKPVVKKETSLSNGLTTVSGTMVTLSDTKKKVINLDDELNKAQGTNAPVTRTVVYINQKVQTDKPFATNSAAMAYDKKHERLYYTPMNINQLRYIDLASNKIYFFEDETFGTSKGFGDAANQITRMAIGADGNGYALSNDGNHLIRFTTGKRPTITDLGPLSDDAKNGNNSVHNPGGFGGDMIADVNDNLYLVTANRAVFKIPVESKVAVFMGTIKGLPGGFSTNGAMVEEGSKVIVASSESTVGYYRFDLNTLQAELASQQGDVFNASDLANGNLAFAKNKKDKEDQPKVEEPKETVADVSSKKIPTPDELKSGGITVYPNPVTDGSVNLSFTDQPVGKYQVQFLDMSGKLISAQEVTVSNKSQVTHLNLPDVAKGSYLIKIASELNKASVTNKVVIQ